MWSILNSNVRLWYSVMRTSDEVRRRFDRFPLHYYLFFFFNQTFVYKNTYRSMLSLVFVCIYLKNLYSLSLSLSVNGSGQSLRQICVKTRSPSQHIKSCQFERGKKKKKKSSEQQQRNLKCRFILRLKKIFFLRTIIEQRN